jgi:hypothetical protein
MQKIAVKRVILKQMTELKQINVVVDFKEAKQRILSYDGHDIKEASELYKSYIQACHAKGIEYERNFMCEDVIDPDEFCGRLLMLDDMAFIEAGQELEQLKKYDENKDELLLEILKDKLLGNDLTIFHRDSASQAYLDLLKKHNIGVRQHLIPADATLRRADYARRSVLCEILEKMKGEEKPADTAPKEDAKNSPTIHYLTDKRVHILQGRYNRLYRDSMAMLLQSKKKYHWDIGAKLGICVLGLVTSYVAAVSGIDETTKTYATTTFSLVSALLAGWQSVVNSAEKSAKLYGGYVVYQELCTELESAFLYFEAKRPYDEIMESITKAMNKYEGSFSKPAELALTDLDMKIREIDNMIQTKLFERNDGHLPAWWTPNN